VGCPSLSVLGGCSEKMSKYICLSSTLHHIVCDIKTILSWIVIFCHLLVDEISD